LLVGSGSMGSLAGRVLRVTEVTDIAVWSRDLRHAAKLAAKVGGGGITTEGLTEAMGRSELIVCATGAARPVVTADVLGSARRPRGTRPLFCLDLGIPRDVDPACRSLEGVTLVDLEVLGGLLASRGEPSGVEDAWGPG